MKKMIMLLALAAAPGLFAGVIVYDNTTNNPVNAVVFSAGGYTQIGDQISLAGTQRLGESATVQLYNLSDSGGTFSATLNLFGVGSLNSPFATYTVNSIGTTGGDFIDVTFSLGGITLPDNLVYAISVSNLSNFVDLAVLTSDTISVGSSDKTFYVNNTGAGLFQDGSPDDNLAFKISANAPITGGGDVPEPSTFVMLGLGIAAVGLGRKFRG